MSDRSHRLHDRGDGKMMLSMQSHSIFTRGPLFEGRESPRARVCNGVYVDVRHTNGRAETV